MPIMVSRIFGIVWVALGLASTATLVTAADNCGMSPRDWCPAPPGDPCGKHRDADACRADPHCTAMPYRGESVVACIYDRRGLPTNCPVVGCISPDDRAKP
jgi:hypothetical protein